MENVAVIGSGIAGLAAARALVATSGTCRVSLFEAASQFGGHAHTVDVTLEGKTCAVDTAFLVYNRRNYPLFSALLAELGVASTPAEMGFSVQAPAQGLEWCGSSLNGLFAQRRNLLRHDFWLLLADIARFNRSARLAARDGTAPVDQTLGAFLDEHGFGPRLRQGYLLPMLACIWSCSPRQALDFPLAALLRFCAQHGLLQITGRPQWLSVQGGSREYVRLMVRGQRDARLQSPVRSLRRGADGLWLQTDAGPELFKRVVLACHSDEAVRLLGDGATAQERSVLGALRYQTSQAVLHTDASVLPQRQAAWAAWNYAAGEPSAGVCLHYLLNRLQALPWKQPLLVSLNPLRALNPRSVIQRFEYAHPVLDSAALAAQTQLVQIQGRQRVWFCGAYAGNGFHEDGLRSGLDAAQGVLDALAGNLGLRAHEVARPRLWA